MDTTKPGKEASDIPGMPKIPGLPNASETPGMSGMPGMPGMPSLPPGMAQPEMVTIDKVTFPKVLFPTDPARHIADMRSLEVRPDDVFVCAFPKAGTHWTWEIVSMLLKGKAEYEVSSKVNMMMDFLPIQEVAATPSPRVFNSHLYFRFLPYQIREKGARIVYVSRNPKDVAVSFYHHSMGMQEPFKFKGSFAEFLPMRFFNRTGGLDWFSYEQDWEKVLDVLPDLKAIHMVYEDMKEDPVRNVERLAEFLGTGASKELCRQIAEACDFKRHKEADKKKVAKIDGFMEPEFLKESKFYRKGEVGDWKNWFTVAQNEMFDQVYAERMKHSKLTFRYTI